MAGVKKRIVGVPGFSLQVRGSSWRRAASRTIAEDLLDPDELAALRPGERDLHDGRKFGSTELVSFLPGR